MDSPLLPGGVVQNAYVVPDLTAACHRFHELYNLGPFFRGTVHPLRDVHYRGVPADPVVIEIACAQAGDVQIELITQSSPGPSAYRDMFAEDEQGFHHSAIFTSDYEATKRGLERAGFPVAMDMAGPGDNRICYVDTRAAFGHMLELYPDHPGLRNVYSFIRNGTSSWDGQELILPLDYLAVMTQAAS
jgi:hypothetical protein